MAFTISEFANVRPHVFHLTAHKNLDLIKSTQTLFPTMEILRAANRTELLEAKRNGHVEVEFMGKLLHIRDQKPLHAGNMSLADGWTFAQFIRYLNERVFFWPGMKTGRPISYGQRHYERYKAEKPILLRISTEAIFSANPNLLPRFSKYNSGSPRYTSGNASPRGPRTFCSCDDAGFSATDTVEVTFPGTVVLPSAVEMGTSPTGPWKEI